VLQAEKDQMEADLKAFKERTARMEAELKFYRAKYPGEAPTDMVFDLAAKPTTTLNDTICPARTSSFPSPISMDSMDSPRDSSCQPETPASSFEAPTPEFDSTQYPAVSVGFGFNTGLSLSPVGGDVGLPHFVQPHAPVDDKPVVIDSLFDFDQFPDGSPASVEPDFGLVDSHVDFFGSTFLGHGPHSAAFGFPDSFDAKFSDLQSASGAPYGSDEALAAEL
jgi:transcriptional activator HAC1